MRKHEILKILNAHEWKEEEAQVSLHIIDHWKTCYLESYKIYQVHLVSHLIYSAVNNYAFEWAPSNQLRKALSWAREKHFSDKNFFWKKYNDFCKVSEGIEKIFKKFLSINLAKVKDKELAKFLGQILKLGKKQYGYGSISEVMDTLCEEDYVQILPNVDANELLEVVRILSALEKGSFLDAEKKDLLKLAIMGSENRYLKEAIKANSLSKIKKYPAFWHALEEHAKKYFWIQNNFRGAIYLDNEYFLTTLSELLAGKKKVMADELKSLSGKEKILKKQREEIYQRYKISPLSKSFFELVRLFSLFQDKRKENIQKLIFCIDQLLNEASHRFSVSKEDVDNYFVSELIHLFKTGKKIHAKKLKEREKTIFFSHIKDNNIYTEIFFTEKSDLVLDFFKSQRQKISNNQTLKGFVASNGSGKESLIRGKIKIIFDPFNNDFKKDEILVTGMTRPEFVPLMKKAKAIITNEGGITTHASIVSRELKVPCIIGTKIATDVLKNGDEVEINLKTGEICHINH